MRRFRIQLLVAATFVVSAAGCGGGPAPSASPSGADATPDATVHMATAPLATPAASGTQAPRPIEGPAATVFVPESQNELAGLLYTCGGPSFPLEIFEGPGHAEASDDPAAAVLLGPLMLGGTANWWLIDRTPTTARYVGLHGHGGYWYLLAEIHEGAWRARGYGDCQMRAVVPDKVVVTWWIPEARWPKPGDRTLDVTVRDGCPDSIRDRLLDPIVRYGSDRVVIILASEPARNPKPPCGDWDDQLARVTVELAEPVGTRTLWDGASWPLRDAHNRSEPLIWCCG